MKWNTDRPAVAFSARIPEIEKIALDAMLEMRGGKTWAVVTALEHFLAIAETDEETLKWCHAAVQKMLHEEDTPTGLVEFTVRVPGELYRRFNKILGVWGGTTWFIRRFINQYVKLAETWPTPESQILEAVKAMTSMEEPAS